MGFALDMDGGATLSMGAVGTRAGGCWWGKIYLNESIRERFLEET